MEVRWNIFFRRMVIFLAAEISLTYLGLDNLADYSEFLEAKSVLVRQS